jgi:hypothetical protein
MQMMVVDEVLAVFRSFWETRSIMECGCDLHTSVNRPRVVVDLKHGVDFVALSGDMRKLRSYQCEQFSSAVQSSSAASSAPDTKLEFVAGRVVARAEVIKDSMERRTVNTSDAAATASALGGGMEQDNSFDFAKRMNDDPNADPFAPSALDGVCDMDTDEKPVLPAPPPPPLSTAAAASAAVSPSLPLTSPARHHLSIREVAQLGWSRLPLTMSPQQRREFKEKFESGRSSLCPNFFSGRVVHHLSAAFEPTDGGRGRLPVRWFFVREDALSKQFQYIDRRTAFDSFRLGRDGWTYSLTGVVMFNDEKKHFTCIFKSAENQLWYHYDSFAPNGHKPIRVSDAQRAACFSTAMCFIFEVDADDMSYEMAEWDSTGMNMSFDAVHRGDDSSLAIGPVLDFIADPLQKQSFASAMGLSPDFGDSKVAALDFSDGDEKTRTAKPRPFLDKGNWTLLRATRRFQAVEALLRKADARSTAPFTRDDGHKLMILSHMLLNDFKFRYDIGLFCHSLYLAMKPYWDRAQAFATLDMAELTRLRGNIQAVTGDKVDLLRVNPARSKELNEWELVRVLCMTPFQIKNLVTALRELVAYLQRVSGGRFFGAIRVPCTRQCMGRTIESDANDVGRIIHSGDARSPLTALLVDSRVENEKKRLASILEMECKIEKAKAVSIANRAAAAVTRHEAVSMSHRDQSWHAKRRRLDNMLERVADIQRDADKKLSAQDAVTAHLIRESPFTGDSHRPTNVEAPLYTRPFCMPTRCFLCGGILLGLDLSPAAIRPLAPMPLVAVPRPPRPPVAAAAAAASSSDFNAIYKPSKKRPHFLVAAEKDRDDAASRREDEWHDIITKDRLHVVHETGAAVDIVMREHGISAAPDAAKSRAAPSRIPLSELPPSVKGQSLINLSKIRGQRIRAALAESGSDRDAAAALAAVFEASSSSSDDDVPVDTDVKMSGVAIDGLSDSSSSSDESDRDVGEDVDDKDNERRARSIEIGSSHPVFRRSEPPASTSSVDELMSKLAAEYKLLDPARPADASAAITIGTLSKEKMERSEALKNQYRRRVRAFMLTANADISIHVAETFSARFGFSLAAAPVGTHSLSVVADVKAPSRSDTTLNPVVEDDVALESETRARWFLDFEPFSRGVFRVLAEGFKRAAAVDGIEKTIDFNWLPSAPDKNCALPDSISLLAEDCVHWGAVLHFRRTAKRMREHPIDDRQAAKMTNSHLAHVLAEPNDSALAFAKSVNGEIVKSQPLHFEALKQFIRRVERAMAVSRSVDIGIVEGLNGRSITDADGIVWQASLYDITGDDKLLMCTAGDIMMSLARMSILEMIRLHAVAVYSADQNDGGFVKHVQALHADEKRQAIKLIHSAIAFVTPSVKNLQATGDLVAACVACPLFESITTHSTRASRHVQRLGNPTAVPDSPCLRVSFILLLVDDSTKGTIAQRCGRYNLVRPTSREAPKIAARHIVNQLAAIQYNAWEQWFDRTMNSILARVHVTGDEQASAKRLFIDLGRRLMVEGVVSLAKEAIEKKSGAVFAGGRFYPQFIRDEKPFASLSAWSADGARNVKSITNTDMRIPALIAVLYQVTGVYVPPCFLSNSEGVKRTCMMDGDMRRLYTELIQHPSVQDVLKSNQMDLNNGPRLITPISELILRSIRMTGAKNPERLAFFEHKVWPHVRSAAETIVTDSLLRGTHGDRYLKNTEDLLRSYLVYVEDLLGIAAQILSSSDAAFICPSIENKESKEDFTSLFMRDVARKNGATIIGRGASLFGWQRSYSEEGLSCLDLDESVEMHKSLNNAKYYKFVRASCATYGIALRFCYALTAAHRRDDFWRSVSIPAERMADCRMATFNPGRFNQQTVAFALDCMGVIWEHCPIRDQLRGQIKDPRVPAFRLTFGRCVLLHSLLRCVAFAKSFVAPMFGVSNSLTPLIPPSSSSVASAKSLTTPVDSDGDVVM